MPSNLKAVLVAGALSLGGMLGVGITSASAQAIGSQAPADPASSTRLASGGGEGTATHGYPPIPSVNPVSGSGGSAGARGTTPSLSTGPGGSRGAASRRPVVPPYTVPAPPPPRKPSALRRFFTFLYNGGEPEGTESRPAYSDPSTGRTDLAGARPWLSPSR